MLSRYLGDKAFLKRVLTFAIPVIIQNGITTFVSLLDNIMVGQVETVQMSGVSVVNQLIMVFNLCIFGATSGAGIFTAQFHGSADTEGVRYTVRYKFWACIALALAGIGILLPGGGFLINLYLQGEGDPAAAAQTLFYGREYLNVMLWGFVPFAMTNMYASSLRECGESKVPMFSGVVAVLVNLCLNFVLIFGLFGMPKLEAKGAAIATVVSRYVEFAILFFWTHLNSKKYPFVKGLYRSLYIPGELIKRIFVKGSPLLLNEFLWSTGMATLTGCYSSCGLDVVPALNISETVNNLASVFSVAIATTVGIIMGQMMGAKRPAQEIRDSNNKLLTLAGLGGILFGLLLAAISGSFPLLYKTTDEVRALATQLILVLAIMKPAMSYLISVYYTLRSGGKTIMTFLYDSGAMWLVSIPLAVCLCEFTQLPILPLYLLCQCVDILKAVVGFFILRKGTWIQNLSGR